MARYIDADKLEKDFPQSVSKHNVIINGNEYPVFLVDHVLHKIRNYPTADVVEVRHGEWDDSGRYKFADGSLAIRCSECGCALHSEEYEKYHWNYCPTCGAKMDGERRDT